MFIFIKVKSIKFLKHNFDKFITIFSYFLKKNEDG